jgi:hypothetical protein
MLALETISLTFIDGNGNTVLVICKLLLVSFWCHFHCWYSTLTVCYFSFNSKRKVTKRMPYTGTGRAYPAHNPELPFNSLHVPLAKGID